jgi:hypothetical protein
MNYEEIRGKCDEIIRFDIIRGGFKFKVKVIIRDKIMEYIKSPVSIVVDNLLFEITYSNSYKDLVAFCNFNVDKKKILDNIMETL